MGWLAGWSHRKTVTITGQSGAGADYQVNLSIGDASGGDFHLENHCTSFPNDITVTDNDQTTPLDYWVEDLTLDPISMWVEVADDLGSNADVCVYYTKSGESSASNEVNTFLDGCADDYESANNFFNSLSGYSLVTTDYVSPTHSIYCADGGGGDYFKRTTSTKNWPSGDFAIHNSLKLTTIYTGGTPDHAQLMLFKNSADSAWSGPHIAIYAGNLQYYDAGFYDSGWTMPTGTWYHFKTIVDVSASTFDVYTSPDKVTWTKRITSGTYLDALSSGTAVTVYGGGKHGTNTSERWFDDYFWCKYNDPEPAYSSAGSEENAPVGAIMNQFQGANIGADLYDGALIT